MSVCFTSNDCVLVDTNCCGCSAGGGRKCINKKYVDEWNKNLDCASAIKEGLSCPQVYLCDSNPTKCKCSEGVCLGIKPAGLEEVIPE